MGPKASHDILSPSSSTHPRCHFFAHLIPNALSFWPPYTPQASDCSCPFIGQVITSHGGPRDVPVDCLSAKRIFPSSTMYPQSYLLVVIIVNHPCQYGRDFQGLLVSQPEEF